MRVLLDTHIALWAVLKTERLSPETKEYLQDPGSKIFYNVISIWKVSLKHSFNPGNMEIPPSEFRKLCQAAGFTEIPIEYQHVLGLDLLVQKDGCPIHKDPFDRILLAQAMVEKMCFLTHDSRIPTFEYSGIISV